MSSKKTLRVEDIRTSRSIDRRSALGRIGAMFAGAAAVTAAAGLPSTAEASCNDNDSGTNSDPAGRGRSCASHCPRNSCLCYPQLFALRGSTPSYFQGAR